MLSVWAFAAAIGRILGSSFVCPTVATPIPGALVALSTMASRRSLRKDTVECSAGNDKILLVAELLP